MISVRPAIPSDYDRLGQIMFEAIHAEPSPYSAAERTAWRAEPYAGADWQDRLSKQAVFVAEEKTEPVGFLTLTPDGYVDLGFIVPRARGRGVFRALYGALETHAQKDSLTHLSTHASLSAEGPFLAMGFIVTDHETVALNGEQLRRVAMVKPLS